MKIKNLCWLSLALLGLGSSAQVVSDPGGRGSDAPAVPAFAMDKLIPLEMPRHLSLRFGIDPQTLSISPDGIVSYVMVAINASGTVSAMYEGIRCPTWEVKTYARYTPSGQWSVVKDAQWQGMNEQRSRHAMAFARQGACQSGAGVPASVAAIVKALNIRTQDQAP